MFNFDKRREMTPRPDEEPKFSTTNKFDKRIITFVLISLAIVASLIGAVLLLYYFLFR